MKFTVGYRITNDGSLVNAILKYKENISEVYFSMYNSKSGRGNSWMGDFNSFDAREI